MSTVELISSESVADIAFRDLLNGGVTMCAVEHILATVLVVWIDGQDQITRAFGRGNHAAQSDGSCRSTDAGTYFFSDSTSSSTNSNNSVLKRMNLSTTRSACFTWSELFGEKTTHNVGSAEPSNMY